MANKSNLQLIKLCQHLIMLLRDDKGALLTQRYKKAQMLEDILIAMDIKLNIPKPRHVHKKAIAIIWCDDDIKEVRSDLNDKQISEVLDYLERNHEANSGINWEVINIVCGMLYPEKTKMIEKNK